MKTTYITTFGMLTVAGIVGTAVPCCSVSAKGKNVAFGDQTNIIIWDPVSQTEHFVRDAQFTSNADHFGFIAPSPTKPDLSDASRKAFLTLAALKPAPKPGFFLAGAMAASKSASSVHVIQEADVAGYHATTLLASDSRSLASWMKSNGYTTTPSIQQWTKFYIDKGWYLTAFKVKNPEDLASTGTIRMSFHTKQPFNPFFVPRDNIVSNRSGILKLYFVSDGDYQGHIGADEPWTPPQWTASIPNDSAMKLASQLKLPAESIPQGATVAEYTDTFPRQVTDDLYFTPAPPNYLKQGAIAAALAGAGLIAWNLRRRRLKPLKPQTV